MLESLFNEAAALQACNFIKKETPTQVFSCEHCEIFRNTYFEKHLWTAAFEAGRCNNFLSLEKLGQISLMTTGQVVLKVLSDLQWERMNQIPITLQTVNDGQSVLTRNGKFISFGIIFYFGKNRNCAVFHEIIVLFKHLC